MAASRGRSRSRSRSKSRPSIKSRIKRPGALTRAKRKGESTNKAARRLKKRGTPLQKKQASFYLNVLSKGSKTSARRRKK